MSSGSSWELFPKAALTAGALLQSFARADDHRSHRSRTFRPSPLVNQVQSGLQVILTSHGQPKAMLSAYCPTGKPWRVAVPDDPKLHGDLQSPVMEDWHSGLAHPLFRSASVANNKNPFPKVCCCAPDRVVSLRMKYLAMLVGCLAGVGPLQAGFTEVFSEAALGRDSVIDWRQLGPTYTYPANPVRVVSSAGLGATLSKTGTTPFKRRDQGRGTDGAFFPGEALMCSDVILGSMTLSLDEPVAGLGFQIQNNQLGAYNARMEAFDVAGHSLCVFWEAGVSTTAGDGSTIFLGLLGSQANVSRVVFETTWPPSHGAFHDFVIGHVALVSRVPEAATMVLNLVVLAGAGAHLVWRQRVKKAVLGIDN